VQVACRWCSGASKAAVPKAKRGAGGVNRVVVVAPINSVGGVGRGGNANRGADADRGAGGADRWRGQSAEGAGSELTVPIACESGGADGSGADGSGAESSDRGASVGGGVDGGCGANGKVLGPVPGVDVMAKRSQGWVKCEDRLPYYRDSSCSLSLATTPRPRLRDSREPRRGRLGSRARSSGALGASMQREGAVPDTASFNNKNDTRIASLDLSTAKHLKLLAPATLRKVSLDFAA
jgi:hypothetical protein